MGNLISFLLQARELEIHQINIWIIFPYIGNVITPIDELHHFSEGLLKYQPDID